MKEIPMLFSASMVVALLAGRKTQTRRLKFNGKVGDLIWVRETWRYHDWSDDGEPWVCYRADDAKIFHAGIGEDSAGAPLDKWEELSAPENYAIDNKASDRKWRTSIHMPRWASRIQMRVKSVRSEQLQSISESDAIAEGVEGKKFPGPWWQGYQECGEDLEYAQAVGEAPPDWMIEPKKMRDMSHCDVTAKSRFIGLWMGIHGTESWAANPTVQVIEFEQVKP